MLAVVCLRFTCPSHSIRARATHFSEKVRCSSQVMIGRFWRSLKVGRITE